MGKKFRHKTAPRSCRLLCGGAVSVMALAITVSSLAAETGPDEAKAASPISLATSSTAFGDLPPPPKRIEAPSKQILYLEIILNQQRTGIVSEVMMHDGQIHVPLDDLQRAGMILESEQSLIDLRSLIHVQAEYRQADQSLLIHADDQYLPLQAVGKGRQKVATSPAITALMLNYDLFISQSDENGWQRPALPLNPNAPLDPNNPSVAPIVPAPIARDGGLYASLYHEARFSGSFGVLSSNGVMRRGNLYGQGNSDGLQYIRYDTRFSRTDHDGALLWEFGDYITRNVANASAVRLAGVQLSRDFSIRPDIITYPMPAFTGQAGLPSTVDLLVNGYSLGQHQVNAGAFVIGGLPPLSGAGQAQVVVSDVNGRSIVTNIPFYVSSELLAQGLTDYAVSAGFFREDFGLRNFSYGEFAASAAARHGLTDYLTIEGRVEASRQFALGGAGATLRIGQLGIISGHAAYSQYQGRGGHLLAAGYEFRKGGFSLALRHVRESAFYADLGRVQYRIAREASRQQSSAGVNFNLGAAGQFGLTYADLREANDGGSRYANANYSLTLRQGARLFAQAGRDFSRKGWFAGLSIGLSFGRRDYAQLGISDSDTGARQYRADYNRYLPTQGGVGWNINAVADEDGANQLRGELIWRNDVMELRGGAQHFNNGQGQSRQLYWGGASGALALVDGEIYAANRLSDSFAIISTDGVSGVPIRYEHQLIGNSNKDGKLFLPHINPWYAGLFSIDPLQLDGNYQIDMVEQRHAIAKGRGAMIRFPMNQTQPLLARVVDRNGQFLPAGAMVRLGANPVNPLGWEGLLYIDNISALTQDKLEIQLPDASSCRVTVPYEKLKPDAWDVGVLTCD